LKFQQQSPLKIQYLPQLNSENSEINSIKSELSRAFQQHQEHPQIPIWFGDLNVTNKTKQDKTNYDAS
jgi:hypothetical protein